MDRFYPFIAPIVTIWKNNVQTLISPFVFHRRKKIICVGNKMRVHKFFLWVNYTLKTHLDTVSS